MITLSLCYYSQNPTLTAPPHAQVAVLRAFAMIRLLVRPLSAEYFPEVSGLNSISN